MKLTPRLAAIAELVPKGSVVADIGTDHAYLPVYLVSEQICPTVVATDINSAPLEQARETLAAFNCLHKVDLRQGEGLSVLHFTDDVDTIIIAGLGGNTIAGILEEDREKIISVQRLILQPMNNSGPLRVYLAQNGFALHKEILVIEGRKLYEIILAKPGVEMETDLFRLYLGPRLLEKRNPLLTVLLKEKIRKLRIVQRSLEKARQKDVFAKSKEVESLLLRLEEVLSVVAGPDTD